MAEEGKADNEERTLFGTRTAGLSRQEKEQAQKCREIIAKMKVATDKRRNIPNEVKLGLVELEDAIEVILSFQAKRQEAEEAAKKVAPPADKRPASSPAGTNEEKRKREDSLYEERIVTSKREKRRRKAEERKKEAPETVVSKLVDPPKASSGNDDKKRRRRPRSEAVLIKPQAGQTYADVLREIRNKVNPESTGTKVKSIRQTRTGGVLLEIGEEAAKKGAFEEEIKSILGKTAVVSSLEPRCTIEIRDLDCLTSEADVKAALERDIPDLGEVKIGLTPINPRGQRVAIVELREKMAAKLLNEQKIRIGWVYCRARRRVAVKRCFRCLGYGHMARDCKGPDRSTLCYKCGGTSHKAKECTGSQRCVLCTHKGLSGVQASHAAGSGRCSVFRDELEKAKALVK